MLFLCSPATLSSLEAGDDHPLWMSTRDGTAGFDQLKPVDELRPYAGRPAVTVVNELLRAVLKGERHQLQQAISLTELQEFSDFDVHAVSGECPLIPPPTCLLMGHSFSAAIARNTMLGTILDSGIEIDEMLSDEIEHAAPACTTAALAIDDVNCFRAWFPKSCGKSAITCVCC